MGTLAADQIPDFHKDRNELDVATFLTGDQITNFTRSFDDLEVVERSADFRFTVAARDIPVGKVIAMFDGAIDDKCSRYTYAIGENAHVRNSTCLVLSNHSCSPNTALQFPGPSPHASEFSSLAALAEAYPEEVFPVFVAIAPIPKGEEVTWNYCSTEWEMSCPFDCECSGGRDLCVGTVRGAKYLTPAQKTRNSPLMAPHILRLMKASESDTAVDRKSVCILASSYANGKDALNDVDQFKRTPAYVNHCHDFDYHELLKDDCFVETRKLILSGKYDVFFNLCDGAHDTTTAGWEVIRALETYGAAFTGQGIGFVIGCGPNTYEQSKVEMKILAADAGISVPPYFVLKKWEDGIECIEELFEQVGLSFPVIVKHLSGYSSVGMTRNSRCSNFEELRQQATQLLDAYGECLVEKFIEGEEVTVLAFEGPCVVEPLDKAKLQKRVDADRYRGQGCVNTELCTTLVPIKMNFPENETFKHFDLKWVSHAGMKWEPITDIVRNLACREVAATAFRAVFGGVGYGRSDLRIDADGKIWFLEINANCGIFYPAGCACADIILKYDQVVDAERFVNLMIAAAIRRQTMRKLARPCFDVVCGGPSGGHCLRANRLIKEGELVFADEGRAVNLVSKQHVEKTWSEVDQLLFRQYAWPFSKDVYAIWSDNPKVWRPINHSCDPTCWYAADSLHVYARKNIPRGGEITVDYSTYCSPENLEPFECRCGASNCRKFITAKDLSEMAAQYGSNVTFYVEELLKSGSRKQMQTQVKNAKVVGDYQGKERYRDKVHDPTCKQVPSAV